jgi:hypothetical protein
MTGRISARRPATTINNGQKKNRPGLNKATKKHKGHKVN